LVDITPQGANQAYPFVRHLGADEEFEEFANQGEINVCAPADTINSNGFVGWP
jgi:hypothetical protein